MDWLKVLEQFNNLEGVNAFLAAQLARYPQAQRYVEWVKLLPAAPADASLAFPLVPGGNVVAVKAKGALHQLVKFAASFLGGLPAQ